MLDSNRFTKSCRLTRCTKQLQTLFHGNFTISCPIYFVFNLGNFLFCGEVNRYPLNAYELTLTKDCKAGTFTLLSCVVQWSYITSFAHGVHTRTQKLYSFTEAHFLTPSADSLPGKSFLRIKQKVRYSETAQWNLTRFAALLLLLHIPA